MNCKLCQSTNNIRTCPKCAYNVCGRCISDGCAPFRCLCTQTDKRIRTRSKDDLFTEVFALREAITAYNTATDQKDDAKRQVTLTHLVKVLDEHRFAILTHSRLRSVVTCKMQLVARNPHKAVWLDRSPVLQQKARELYEFFRWNSIPVGVGTDYIPASFLAAQSSQPAQ